MKVMIVGCHGIDEDAQDFEVLETQALLASNGLEVDVVGPGVPLVYALGGGAPPLRQA
jgi:hypothetical protein